jgi:hypothetical protein
MLTQKEIQDYLDQNEYLEDCTQVYQTLPKEVRDTCENFNEDASNSYEECAKLVNRLEELGYTIDYYLDGVPFNLRKLYIPEK